MSHTGTLEMETAGHLSDEQFAGLASGLECAEAAAHGLACAQCREELEAFGGAVREFGGAARGWSESRSPMSWQQQMRKASRKQTAAAPVSTSRRRLVAASCAMAAAAVLAVGAAAWTHREAATVVPPTALAYTDGHELARATEIAQDNALMRDVNVAISRDDASAMRAYGLTVAGRQQARPNLEMRSQ